VAWGYDPKRSIFPVLFGIECVKDTVVAAHMELSDGSNKRNVSFTRALVIGRCMSLHRSPGCCIQLEKLWWIPSDRDGSM